MCFNIHTTNRAVLVSDQPLIHTIGVEEMHTGQTSAKYLKNYMMWELFSYLITQSLTAHRSRSQTRTNKLRTSQHPRPIRWVVGHVDIYGAMCCAR